MNDISTCSMSAGGYGSRYRNTYRFAMKAMREYFARKMLISRYYGNAAIGIYIRRATTLDA